MTEGVQHAAELLLDHAGAIAGDLEGLQHQFRQMVAHRARAQLVAVADDVVLVGQDVQGVLGLQGLHLALRHREGVVREVDVVGLLVHLEHREVDDPDEFEAVLVDQLQVGPDLGAGRARELVEGLRITGDEEGGVALPQADAGHQSLRGLGAEVLGDRAAPGALVLAPEDVAEAGLPLALGPRVHTVAERAAAALRRGDRPHGVLGVFQDAGEQAKAAAAEAFRDIGHLDGVAQVGLVAAVPGDGVAVGDARERIGRDALAVGELFEDAVHHRLDGVEDVVLGDEAHLHVELVEFQAAVGAQVLVAEAGRDLEVAVEAGDHQQLLELLGGLRQGVELRRVDARGHQEVARAFRRRGRQDRCLVLQEALADHAVADRVDDLGAQDDILVQGLAAQVEIAVLEPQLFGIVGLAEHRQRQLGGLGDHVDGRHADLDLAGGQVGIDGVGRAGQDLAVHPDHALGAQALDAVEARGLGADHQLGQAIVVAQVDEHQPAVVALAMDPARQPDILARVRRPEGAAGMGTVGMHGRQSSRKSRRGRAHEGGRKSR